MEFYANNYDGDSCSRPHKFQETIPLGFGS